MGKRRGSGKSGRSGKHRRSKPRGISLAGGFLVLGAFTVWTFFADWYVHHPGDWRRKYECALPRFVTSAIYSIGNRAADFTDALDLTGYDCVYEYDETAPENTVLFAGAPVRTGSPAPGDITVLDRGHFIIGYSPSLRHPVWVAYHVVKDGTWQYTEARPPFRRDRSCPESPTPDAYTRSGYDRGHMAPNYAIFTRYGEDARDRTFLMSNIAPQSPALNRGVWRDLEHRIAEYWTEAYGEIWVVVGCFSENGHGAVKIGGSIDVPEYFYQVIVAQRGMDVRALAVLLPQDVDWNAYAARNLISIDELEARTGLDFNPNLPSFIQAPLEAECPSRLWPVSLPNALRLLFGRR